MNTLESKHYDLSIDASFESNGGRKGQKAMFHRRLIWIKWRLERPESNVLMLQKYETSYETHENQAEVTSLHSDQNFWYVIEEEVIIYIP